jgi:hypothetical protein
VICQCFGCVLKFCRIATEGVTMDTEIKTPIVSSGPDSVVISSSVFKLEISKFPKKEGVFVLRWELYQGGDVILRGENIFDKDDLSKAFYTETKHVFVYKPGFFRRANDVLLILGFGQNDKLKLLFGINSNIKSAVKALLS